MAHQVEAKPNDFGPQLELKELEVEANILDLEAEANFKANLKDLRVEGNLTEPGSACRPVEATLIKLEVDGNLIDLEWRPTS